MAQDQQPESLATLQVRLLDALDDFSAEAGEQGVPDQQVDHARYALCALLDETILSSSWGADGWADYSLLAAAYGEGFGGEAFFDRLNQAGAQRGDAVTLLEFFHLCLSLGYTGRFHPRRQSRDGIEQLRLQVATLVRQFRQSLPLLTAPRVADREPKRKLPIWVLAALTGALLLGVYRGLDWTLSTSAGQVLADLQSISRER